MPPVLSGTSTQRWRRRPALSKIQVPGLLFKLSPRVRFIEMEIRMLVLTRKLGEEIVIGDNIRVRVVEINGGKVRLGITAPDSVPVNRMEVLEKRMKALSEPA